MKPLRIEARLRNNVMASWREANGLNQRQAAARVGINESRWGNYESLKICAYLQNGRMKKDCSKISEEMGIPPEEIWPLELKLVDGKRRSVEIDFHEVAMLSDVIRGPHEIAELNEDLTRLAEEIERLPDRERVVIEKRVLLEETLEEVGEHFGFSRERARQIELRAIRKLGESKWAQTH